jgi:hypothetical protein
MAKEGWRRGLGAYSGDMGKDKITPGKSDVGNSTTPGREVPLPKDEPGGLSGPAPLPKR